MLVLFFLIRARPGSLQTAVCNPGVTPAPLGCTDSSFTGGSLKHLSEVGVFDSSCVAISRLIHTMDVFDGGVTFNVQVREPSAVRLCM